MSTTSIKLSDELKQRAALAAQQQGITPHAFMVEAIEKAASAAERHSRFVAEANAARELMLQSGQGYAADEVHTYLRDKLAGKTATRPESKPWRA